jgi:hypothetical protein
MTPAEARRSALRDFGGIEAIKEQARDARGGRPVEDLLRDIRYAGACSAGDRTAGSR